MFFFHFCIFFYLFMCIGLRIVLKFNYPNKFEQLEKELKLDQNKVI